MFTRLSVHWADRITATINSKGSLYFNSLSATGIFPANHPNTPSYLSFVVIFYIFILSKKLYTVQNNPTFDRRKYT